MSCLCLYRLLFAPMDGLVITIRWTSWPLTSGLVSDGHWYCQMSILASNIRLIKDFQSSFYGHPCLEHQAVWDGHCLSWYVNFMQRCEGVAFVKRQCPKSGISLNCLPSSSAYHLCFYSVGLFSSSSITSAFLIDSL